MTRANDKLAQVRSANTLLVNFHLCGLFLSRESKNAAREAGLGQESGCQLSSDNSVARKSGRSKSNDRSNSRDGNGENKSLEPRV